MAETEGESLMTYDECSMNTVFYVINIKREITAALIEFNFLHSTSIIFDIISKHINAIISSCHEFTNLVATEIGLLHRQQFTNSHFHFLIIEESTTYKVSLPFSTLGASCHDAFARHPDVLWCDVRSVIFEIFAPIRDVLHSLHNCQMGGESRWVTWLDSKNENAERIVFSREKGFQYPHCTSTYPLYSIQGVSRP